VPPGTLSRAGVTLAAAKQPPYCGWRQDAGQAGTIPASLPGCAVTRRQAEGALLPGFRGSVVETALARASGPSASGIGRGRLVWLVVVRSNLLVLPTTSCGPCGSPRPPQVSNRAVAIVDGWTAQVLTVVPVLAGAQNGASAGSV